MLPPEGAIRRVIGARDAFARIGSGTPQAFIRHDERTVLHAQRPVILNGTDHLRQDYA